MTALSFEGYRLMQQTHRRLHFLMNFSNIGGLNIEDGPENLGG
jgi:hypothetical protein